MKKIFIVLAVLVLLVSPVFAAGEKIDFYLYGKAGGDRLTGGNALDIAFGNDNSSFALLLKPELLVYFDGSNGLDTGISFIASDSFGFGLKVGYSHLFNIVDKLDVALNAGFKWDTVSEFHTFAIYVDADFLYNFTGNFHFTFGATNEFPFATISKVDDKTSMTDTFFASHLILPTVGFGYRF